jgi:hypothetical protein
LGEPGAAFTAAKVSWKSILRPPPTPFEVSNEMLYVLTISPRSFVWNVKLRPRFESAEVIVRFGEPVAVKEKLVIANV